LATNATTDWTDVKPMKDTNATHCSGGICQ
jgi:hypothetical protein